ncbi:DUF5050 domain-containing protein [Clostridium brassicae]|uniref:DUF5050 domain-containing protein n=1 Tax=Clostridium brassicae TaxID=2999072 RepID=A0ABT4DAM0_9CLOT|nr:DUF5050 domain-containing protein [Clostridium brassicae]MCY6959369.1 DUF5050 domain-containing protein [Clostridium brassicae]
MKESYRKGAAALAVLATLMWIPNVSLGVTKDKDDDSKYEVRYSKIPVEERKSWKIKFNKELDSGSINSTNIIIEDEKGNSVSADISLDKDDKQKKTVLVKPYSSLKQGEKYHMIIKGDVKSKNGRKIRKPVKVYFNTKNVFAGLPCEEGLIIVGDIAYSIDYLAQNAKLRNEIINEEYYIYYCYSPTEQKIKDIFKDEELKSKDVNRRYDTMTYINENGDKAIYEWSYKNSEYELLTPGVDVNITANSNAKVVTVKVNKVRGVDDATYFKLSSSNDMKKIGETFVFTSANMSEKIYILNSNKNIVATGRLLVSFSNSGYKTLKIITDSNKGNTTGNINNNGYAAEDNDGYLFYNNTGDKNSLYKLDTNGMFNNAIAYDNAQYINVLDEWVYYSNYSDKGKLYRIKTDGTGKQKLADDMAAYTTVSGDWIYYSNHSDGGKLYKIRPNGKDRRQVNSALNHEVAYINVLGSWIYYTDKTDKHTPYVTNLEGSYVSKLSEQWADSIQVVGDWIYYTSSTGVLSKVKKDGSGEIIPIQGQTREFDKGFHLNVVGSWIYYSNYLDGGKLYRVRTDGSGEKLKLTNETVGYINIVADYIYYTSSGKLYRLPIDADGKIKGELVTKGSGDNKIIQMDDLKVTVPYYDVDMKLSDIENKYLPKKVPGIKDDNTMNQFSVTWDRDKVTVKNGIRVYTGDIIGYNRKVKLELEIPSEMLNETNTITIYNNPDKSNDIIEIKNIASNDRLSVPKKLIVGDIVNVYDSEDSTRSLSKATVVNDGKYNKAVLQRLDLDTFPDKNVWISVIRKDKSESRRTKVKLTTIPLIREVKDVDDIGLGKKISGKQYGVDGRDFKICDWESVSDLNSRDYDIFILPSRNKLDLSTKNTTNGIKNFDSISSGRSTWQGSRGQDNDSKQNQLKGGKYDIFVAGEYTTTGGEDARGKRPDVIGYVSSKPATIDVKEEVLPNQPSIKAQKVNSMGVITLDKAPAPGETVWLIPSDKVDRVVGYTEEDKASRPWPSFADGEATFLTGDGTSKIITTPRGDDPRNPSYQDKTYRLIAVNNVGASPISANMVTVDNQPPVIVDKERLVTILHPEDRLGIKVKENADLYIVRHEDDYGSKENLENAVKLKTGKVKKFVGGNYNYLDFSGLKAGKNNVVPNYRIVAVDEAGNIAEPIDLTIYVNIDNLNALVETADNHIRQHDLTETQQAQLEVTLRKAKDTLDDYENLTQRSIDMMTAELRKTLLQVGIVPPSSSVGEIVEAETNGLYLMDMDGKEVVDKENIIENLKLVSQGRFDRLVRIEWQTSDSSVINISGEVGKVNRMVDKDSVVTLTAKVTKEGVSKQKQFRVLVKGIKLKPYLRKADGADGKIFIDFNGSEEEERATKYKIVFVKKDENYKGITPEEANAKQGIDVNKTGAGLYSQEINIADATTKDVNGESLVVDQVYKVFILAEGKNIEGNDIYSLSDGKEVTIK